MFVFSQPDISPNDTLERNQSPGHQSGTDRDFEALFDAANSKTQNRTEYWENGERSFSESFIGNGLNRSRSEEKESEVDSGIAIIEHSVSTLDYSCLPLLTLVFLVTILECVEPLRSAR